MKVTFSQLAPCQHLCDWNSDTFSRHCDKVSPSETVAAMSTLCIAVSSQVLSLGDHKTHFMNLHSTSGSCFVCSPHPGDFANDYYSHIFCSVREALKQTPVIFALMSFLLLMNIEGLGLGRAPLSGFKLQLRLGWRSAHFPNTDLTVPSWPHCFSRRCFKSAAFAFGRFKGRMQPSRLRLLLTLLFRCRLLCRSGGKGTCRLVREASEVI